MRKIERVILHTAATTVDGKAADVSARAIRRWHRERKGWSDIGYHWVVRFNGAVEIGRPESQVGAGVFGFNANTIHVCFSGHGDLAPPTDQQWAAALTLCAQILGRYGLTETFRRNPNRVLGHNEVWHHRLVPKPIRKTCPGRLTDMRKFRLDLLARLPS